MVGVCPKTTVKLCSGTRKAAEQGSDIAQCALGKMYASGEGVPQDYDQAAAWFQKAAEQGNAQAQTLLGSMYASGEGRL